MEFAVDRQGNSRSVEGCGSVNIERSKRKPGQQESPLSSIVSGEYALIDGAMLRVEVDNEMGKNEDEYIREGRKIILNGNYPAYRVAARLDSSDGKSVKAGDELFLPALTVHITKCLCLAWGELHYDETQKWDDFKNRFEDLQVRIYKRVAAEIGHK